MLNANSSFLRLQFYPKKWTSIFLASYPSTLGQIQNSKYLIFPYGFFSFFLRVYWLPCISYLGNQSYPQWKRNSKCKPHHTGNSFPPTPTVNYLVWKTVTKKKEGKREIFHLLVHSTNGHSQPELSQVKPEVLSGLQPPKHLGLFLLLSKTISRGY